MSRFVLAAAAFLFATLAATACDYGQRAVCGQQQSVYAQAVVQQAYIPQVAQVVVPTVQSVVQYQPVAVQQVYAAPVVQQQVVVQRQAVYGGYGGGVARAQFVGGRQRAFGGGGGIGGGGVINAVNNLVNSPAGTFALGAFVGNGFKFGR